MHGHGDKPYTCEFTDCERSFRGNGFPRRWNLQDHMKRVHDYTGPLGSSGSTSPSPSSASSVGQGKANGTIRKRGTSNQPAAQQPKRTKSVVSAKANSKPIRSQSGVPQGKSRYIIQKEWHEQHAALRERIDSLDPTDARGHEQIAADYALLNNIGINLRRLESGQIAPY